MNGILILNLYQVKPEVMSSTPNQPGDDDGVAKRDGDLHYPVRAWWLEMLKDWMAEHNESVLGLSQRVGANDVTIGNIIKGKTRESAYIPAICRATSLPLPTVEASWRRVKRSPDVQKAIDDFEAIAQIDPELAKAKQEDLAALLAAMKRKK